MRIAVVWAVTLAIFTPVLASGLWNISTPSLGAVFSGANIVALENRLTGELVGLGDPNPTGLSGLRLVTHTVRTESMDPVMLVYNSTCAVAGFQGQAVNYTLIARALPSGDVGLVQRGSSQNGGLAEIMWGIGGIQTSTTSLIIPGTSGIKIDSDYPLESYRFNWPTLWEAQMIILKTEKGGFLIWSDDTSLRFKDLYYSRRDGMWYLAFSTENEAPFEPKTKITSVHWRITAFEGDWRVAAEIYRNWMEANYNLTTLGAEIPWAEDISFVVIMEVNKDLLPELADRVNASATLLYIPNWRCYDYDRYYPNYTARKGFSEFVSEAHRLGFKVMVHVNYFGVSPEHPLYQELKEYQMRDPYTGEPLWWVWDRVDPPIRIAYINPASERWRSILVDALKEVKARYGVDAFHLDCTLAVFNDANGPIDGMTSTQGNLELHREIRESLPGVALGGEGLNELTIRYEDFSQRHVLLGIRHHEGKWDWRLIDHLHPICAYLFTPYNGMYGYLGICEPDAQPDLWHAWEAAYEAIGVLPTLWLRRANQFEAAGPEMQALLDKARYFTNHNPKPTFPNPDRDVKFSYRTMEGYNLTYSKRRFGVVLEEESPQGTRLICGRVQNATSACTEGGIPGWIGYNSTHLFGLDPTKIYVLLARNRSLSQPHIARLPRNVVLTRAINRSSILAFRLERTPLVLLDMVESCNSASALIRLENGTWRHMGWGATFRGSRLSCGGVQREAIYEIPPSRIQGETIGSYSVQIPQSGARLETYIGLTDLVRPGTSDGVVFTVYVDGQAVFSRQVHGRGWEKVSIDLSSYSGRNVTIGLGVGPGPGGDAAFDLAAWGETRIVPYTPDPATVGVFFPRLLEGVLRDGVDSVRMGNGQMVVASGHLPLFLGLLSTEARAFSPPLCLWEGTFEVKTVRNGLERDPSGYACCIPMEISCGGIAMQSLFEHPPPSGRTEASFILKLPDSPTILKTKVGIRDGSLSEGVVFVVEVNCKEVESLEVLPSGWTDLTVDLSRYRNQTVLLALQTDPDGWDYYDWAAWGTPQIVSVPTIRFPVGIIPLALTALSLGRRMMIRASVRRPRAPFRRSSW